MDMIIIRHTHTTTRIAIHYYTIYFYLLQQSMSSIPHVRPRRCLSKYVHCYTGEMVLESFSWVMVVGWWYPSARRGVSSSLGAGTGYYSSTAIRQQYSSIDKDVRLRLL